MRLQDTAADYTKRNPRAIENGEGHQGRGKLQPTDGLPVWS